MMRFTEAVKSRVKAASKMSTQADEQKTSDENHWARGRAFIATMKHTAIRMPPGRPIRASAYHLMI